MKCPLAVVGGGVGVVDALKLRMCPVPFAGGFAPRSASVGDEPLLPCVGLWRSVLGERRSRSAFALARLDSIGGGGGVRVRGEKLLPRGGDGGFGEGVLRAGTVAAAAGARGRPVPSPSTVRGVAMIVWSPLMALGMALFH